MPSYGQTVTVQYVAWDTANNVGKTGDSANHTLRWVKDGTSSAPANAPSEIDSTNAPGVYKITMTATEAQCQVGTLCGKSSTSNIAILPITMTFENLPTAVPAATGGLATVDSNNGVKLSVGTGTGQISLSSGKAAVTLASTDVSGNLPAQVNAYNSGQDPATLVLDVSAASHNTAGTVGAKINASGSATDPLTNAGSTYSTPGTIGYIINNRVDTTISSRQPSGNVTISGYAAGQDPATLVLVNPSYKLVTDANGRIQVQSGTGTGQISLNAGLVQHDLTQSVPTNNTAQTVGDALNAARAQGFGKWTLSGTTLTLYAADNTTVVRTFTLDSATAPTQRV